MFWSVMTIVSEIMCVRWKLLSVNALHLTHFKFLVKCHEDRNSWKTTVTGGWE